MSSQGSDQGEYGDLDQPFLKEMLSEVFKSSFILSLKSFLLNLGLEENKVEIDQDAKTQDRVGNLFGDAPMHQSFSK